MFTNRQIVIVIIILLALVVLFALHFHYRYFNMDTYDQIKEHFYGYSYPYLYSGYYYPYFNSGCIESMFGGINCYSPPYFY